MVAEKALDHQCPKCGELVWRVRREWRHRAVSLFWPSKRYACSNPRCRWEGLLFSQRARDARRKNIAYYGGSLLLCLLAALLLLALGLLGLAILRHLSG